jgi:hypothetical protein
MVEDGFELEVERLFAEAPALGDEEAFVAAVTTRTARRRRMAQGLHTAALAVGSLIAVLELSQPSLWEGLADWLNRTGAPLVDANLWSNPNPAFSLAVVGALVLGVYLSRVLRES